MGNDRKENGVPFTPLSFDPNMGIVLCRVGQYFELNTGFELILNLPVPDPTLLFRQGTKDAECTLSGRIVKIDPPQPGAEVYLAVIFCDTVEEDALITLAGYMLTQLQGRHPIN